MLLLLPGLAFSESEGGKLVNQFWKNTVAKRIHKISSTMSPQFQGLYMDHLCPEIGGPITKQQELQYLQNLNITSYVLSNIKTTKNKRIMVVTYDIQLTRPVTNAPLFPASPQYHEIFVYYKSGQHWELASLSFFPIAVPV